MGGSLGSKATINSAVFRCCPLTTAHNDLNCVLLGAFEFYFFMSG